MHEYQSVHYWRYTESVGGLSVHYDKAIIGESPFQTESSFNALAPV